jgi:hypothetical protein
MYIHVVLFFWVIPRPLNFMCRRFGTLCLFYLHRSREQDLWTWNTVFRNVGTYNSDTGSSPKRKNTTFRTRQKFEIKNECTYYARTINIVVTRQYGRKQHGSVDCRPVWTVVKINRAGDSSQPCWSPWNPYHTSMPIPCSSTKLYMQQSRCISGKRKVRGHVLTEALLNISLSWGDVVVLSSSGSGSPIKWHSYTTDGDNEGITILRHVEKIFTNQYGVTSHKIWTFRTNRLAAVYKTVLCQGALLFL